MKIRLLTKHNKYYSKYVPNNYFKNLYLLYIHTTWRIQFTQKNNLVFSVLHPFTVGILVIQNLYMFVTEWAIFQRARNAVGRDLS